MNIQLNVNDLVEQLVELTRHQNEAIRKVSELSAKVIDLEQKLVDREVTELKDRVDYERGLDQMAKQYEAEQLNVALSKIVNG